MVKIEINGQLVEASEGDMLIDVADDAAINIPRFCYHKKLSIAANCRMCLVEVEGSPKPVPACATPVTDGMKVKTNSPRAVAAQKGVMEFLLINHPLDCPICDQGGECELQDVAMDYGHDSSQFVEAKRIVGEYDVGSLISTDMTRCIHCTRCVRFGQEIAGIKELGATGRSEWMQIGTYIQKSIGSEMSGNMVDLCPVGALTSKPFRYRARSWELKAHSTISPHDSVGSNLIVHTRNGEVMRVVPDENDAINETWISDRDRYSYQGLNSAERLASSAVKQAGKWSDTEWEQALEQTILKLKPYLANPEDIAILISPNSTLEEIYLAKKIAAKFGITNLEHRLRQQDFRADAIGVKQALAGTIAEVETQDAILIVGSYLRKELPLLNHRVRKAQLAGAKVSMINSADFEYNYDVATEIVNTDLLAELAGVAKAVVNQTGTQNQAWLDAINPTAEQQAIAQQLIDAKNPHIMLGALAQANENYAVLQKLASVIANATNAKFSDLPMSANTVGANLLLAQPACNLTDLLAGKKVFINLGVEPEVDSIFGEKLLSALNSAELVIQMTGFDSEAQRSYADVMLPLALFAENAGTYVNAQGDWQSFKIVAKENGEAKQLWKVLRVLGNMLEVDGFEYTNTQQILEEIQQLNLQNPVLDFASLDLSLDAQPDLVGAVKVAPYSVDSLVRRATALQATPDAMKP